MKRQIAHLPRWVFILVIGAPFIFWFVPLVTGQALYWGTPAMQFIPWRILGLEQLSQGVIPLWNPENGLGAPLLANYQTAYFYPPGWIINLLGWIFGNSGVAWGFTLLLALHGSWAGLGMAYLTRKLNCNATGMIIAALTYSLGSFFIARAGFFPIIWAGSWFPWMLLTIPADISNSRFVWKPSNFPFASILVVSMALLAGHAQLSWYMILFTAAWVISLSWFQNRKKNLWKEVFGYLSIILFAAFLSAVQLIPTAELLANSQRSSSVSFEGGLTYSYWPWRFITFFAPDFFGNPASGNYTGYGSFSEDAAYIGIIPVFLAVSTIIGLFKRSAIGENKVNRNIVILLWILIGIGFIFALGKNTPIFVFLYKYVPSFDMFNSPARFLIWVHMSLCLLAAIGSSSWKTPAGKGLYWFRLGTAGGASVLITGIVMLITAPDLGENFIRAAIIFGILAVIAGTFTLTKDFAERNHHQTLWTAMVLVIVVSDLVAAGIGLNPTMPAREYEKIQSGILSNDMGRTFLEPRAEYAIKYSKYLRFNDYRPLEQPQAVLSGMIPNTNLFTGTALVNNFDPLLVAQFARLMEIFPTMSKQEKSAWLRLMNVDRAGSLDLNQTSGIKYSEVTGNSRVWWFPCNKAADSNEDALALTRMVLADWEENEELATIITEGFNAEQCEGISTLDHFNFKIIEETPARIVIEVSTPQNGWVMLSDTWYPGWQAYLDDEKVEIVRGYSMFRTIQVPAGDHRINMNYKPLSFLLGMVISILGIFILLGLNGMRFLKVRKGQIPSNLRTDQ